MRSRELAFVTVAALTACSLTTDLNGLSSGTRGPDSSSSSSGSATGEGGPSGTSGTLPESGIAIDAPPAVTLPTGGVVIASNVASYPAGTSLQHHVHFAANLGVWVVFYLPADDPKSVRTKVTNDFTAFADGPSITLPRPHDRDGRNLDIAYSNIGGSDVFHVAISIHDHDRFCYRTRGRGAGGVLTFEAPTQLSTTPAQENEMDPDGVSIAILNSGRVLISTGFFDYQTHWGNPFAFHSNTLDDGGATWTPDFANGVEVQYANRAVNARVMIPTEKGASYMWEAGDEEPKPKQLHFASFDDAAKKWSDADDVGFAQTNFNVADWGHVRTPNGTLHTVRYAGDYVYRPFDTTGHEGPKPPAQTHSDGDGLLLLAKDNSPSVFALDASKALRRTTLDGQAWSSWVEVAPADAARSHLSGNGEVVLWQRGTDLVGLRLSP